MQKLMMRMKWVAYILNHMPYFIKARRTLLYLGYDGMLQGAGIDAIPLDSPLYKLFAVCITDAAPLPLGEIVCTDQVEAADMRDHITLKALEVNERTRAAVPNLPPKWEKCFGYKFACALYDGSPAHGFRGIKADFPVGDTVKLAAMLKTASNYNWCTSLTPNMSKMPVNWQGAGTWITDIPKQCHVPRDELVGEVFMACSADVMTSERNIWLQDACLGEYAPANRVVGQEGWKEVAAYVRTKMRDPPAGTNNAGYSRGKVARVLESNIGIVKG